MRRINNNKNVNGWIYNELIINIDEPDAPEKPVVTDWDENFVELQWEQPKTDGGSPVTEFTIQKKERGSPYWVNAVTVPGKETKVKSEKLKQKKNCSISYPILNLIIILVL